MIKLLDLPTEVLECIVWETLPDGFEKLLLTCRVVYTIGKPWIPLHNRCRKYRHLGHRIAQDAQRPEHSSFDYFLDICREPLIAEFVRDVDFGQIPVYTSTHLREEPERYGLVYQTIRRAFYPWLFTLEQVGAWTRALLLESKSNTTWLFSEPMYRYVTLLALLPNARDVRFFGTTGSLAAYALVVTEEPGVASYHDLFLRILDAIASAKHTGPSPLLGKVRTIQFSVPNLDISDRDLSGHQSFITLPVVEELDFERVRASDTCALHRPEPEFAWRCPTAQAQCLRTLRFHHSIIDPHYLDELLSRTPHVTFFTYTHNPNCGPGSRSWDAPSFVQILEKRLGKVLTNLTLDGGGRTQIVSGVISLKGLMCLRQAQVPAGMFGDVGFDISGCDLKGEDISWDVLPPAIILPPTIERIVIIA